MKHVVDGALLSIAGWLHPASPVVAGPYPASKRERVLFDPSGGTFTINAPAAPDVGVQFGVKNVTTSTTAVTISGNGANIEAPSAPGTFAASTSISGAGAGAAWEWDGTQWVLVEGAKSALAGTLDSPLIIDVTDVEAFLVRADGDSGDAFAVDTVNRRILLKGATTLATSFALVSPNLLVTDSTRTGTFEVSASANAVQVGARSNHALQLRTNDITRVEITTNGEVTVTSLATATNGFNVVADSLVGGNVGRFYSNSPSSTGNILRVHQDHASGTATVINAQQDGVGDILRLIGASAAEKFAVDHNGVVDIGHVGSSSVASIIFNGDVDTGIYASAADRIAITAAGTVVYASVGGITTVNGPSGLELDSGAHINFDSVAAGLTASTTQTQGQGPLTKFINQISTVANPNDTRTFPPADTGRMIIIINDGANTLQLYPFSGDDAGAGVDAAVTLAAGSRALYVAIDDTVWKSII